MASTPPIAAFVILAGSDLLDWDAAILASLGCVVVLAVLVRRGLGDVYRVAHFADVLSREGQAELPDRKMSGLFPEFSEAIDKLRDAWDRESGQLGERANSAETILEGLPYPLILINADRQIVRTTVGATDLLGIAEPGRDLATMVRNPGVLEAVDHVLSGGDRELIEFDIQSQTNRSLNAQVERLPAPAPDGSTAVIALFDVTEIKQVHQMRADFVANASHELRTPLSVLSGCVKTLQGAAREDPAGRQKFLDMMDSHATRMTQLIDDLLSLSRIELNENTQPTGEVDLPNILSTVATGLEIPASERGIEIVIEDGGGIDEISGDEREIGQLFRNLVENAVKYSGDAAVVRIVSRRGADTPPPPMEADVPFVEVLVIDTGPGIAAEHIPRLTERFYRVDAARSREMGGTGLGLAIVKHIVNRHRGALTIESVEGEGSTFTVHLPVS